MKCEEAEMNVYLYPELSETERAALNLHLQSCEACSLLFQSLEVHNLKIKQVAAAPENPPHAALLTHKIMEGIQGPEKSHGSWIENLLAHKSLKYSFACASTVLIVMFCLQAYLPDTQPGQHMNSNQTIIINSSALRMQFSKQKEMQKTQARCLSPFRSATVTRECLIQKYTY